MRLTMTGLALRHARMCLSMTEGAGEGLMLGGCFGQKSAFFIVTRNAEGPRCGNWIGDLQWMMRRMATETIVHCLTLGMGLMAFKALRNQAVAMMAEVTGQLSVLAGILLEFLSLLLMAGKAGFGNIAFQSYIKGLVGIRVATQAVLQFKVRASRMTL